MWYAMNKKNFTYHIYYTSEACIAGETATKKEKCWVHSFLAIGRTDVAFSTLMGKGNGRIPVLKLWDVGSGSTERQPRKFLQQIFITIRRRRAVTLRRSPLDECRRNFGRSGLACVSVFGVFPASVVG
jgi:hypothetical protein